MQELKTAATTGRTFRPRTGAKVEEDSYHHLEIGRKFFLHQNNQKFFQ